MIVAVSCWHRDVETVSIFLALCEGNPPINGVFLRKGQEGGSLVFFVCSLNKTNCQSSYRQFETSDAMTLMWRHCNTLPSWEPVAGGCPWPPWCLLWWKGPSLFKQVSNWNEKVLNLTRFGIVTWVQPVMGRVIGNMLSSRPPRYSQVLPEKSRGLLRVAYVTTRVVVVTTFAGDYPGGYCLPLGAD